MGWVSSSNAHCCGFQLRSIRLSSALPCRQAPLVPRLPPSTHLPHLEGTHGGAAGRVAAPHRAVAAAGRHLHPVRTRGCRQL